MVSPSPLDLLDAVFPKHVSEQFCNYCWGGSTLRLKIDTIVQKNTPVPDEDAPDDPSSTRWWCSTGGKMSEEQVMSVEGEARVSVAADPNFIGSLTSADAGMTGMPSLGLPAGAAGPGGNGQGPSLSQIVEAMNQATAGTGQVFKQT